ncbi:ATP-binding protein [Chitinophaga agrisoli]|uniref:ATP-binding protein n=1 Tax=Chitinophaga agrisoli TaxID=2607653 RepID=A0A5B2VUX9_9BACT|nr:AAA family ATPase [Chitinophaga agrisoli]KAA2242584.1 ATP-binding protein [Chitinophaga agrisoli]
MRSSLVVKNFGPIDFVDLDLRNVNVFIGPQASGKSALAKLLTIMKAPRRFLRFTDSSKSSYEHTQNSFFGILEEYNVSSFLKRNTEINFSSELHDIKYKDGELIYTPKLLNAIDEIELLKSNFEHNTDRLTMLIKQITNKFIFINLHVSRILHGEHSKILFTSDSAKLFSSEKLDAIISVLKETEANLSSNTALYIPSERAFINIIKNASLNLIHNNVPIPKHILAFGAEVEKSVIREIDLSFLHKKLIYRNINGEDRIFTEHGDNIKLTEAASGIQSVLPVLIPILHHQGAAGHRSFVIEEPELNLFPLAQYELIKKLESTRREAVWDDYGSIHTYTTHSPYILSALNNLLYANKIISTEREFKGGIQNDKRKKIENAVSQVVSSNINPYYFTAYQIRDGRAESIIDRNSGLIMNNYIDEASDTLADDFDALLNIEKQWRNF